MNQQELFDKIKNAGLGGLETGTLFRLLIDGGWENLLYDTSLMEYSFGLPKGSLEGRIFKSDEEAILWLLDNCNQNEDEDKKAV